MASIYTNSAALTKKVSAARRLALLDRDRDGSEDTGVLDDAIAEAGAMIDMRLAQRYGSASPLFALITDTPATPEPIQRIAMHLLLWQLYAFWEPEGRDATFHFGAADTLLTGLLEAKFDISGVARASASDGRVVVVYEADEPTFAGVDENDVSRTRGI